MLKLTLAKTATHPLRNIVTQTSEGINKIEQTKSRVTLEEIYRQFFQTTHPLKSRVEPANVTNARTTSEKSERSASITVEYKQVE